MSLKPFLIGPFETGLQNNLEPWLLPEDAFETLEDAYVWRGRIKKRIGSALIGLNPLLSRLRVNIGTTDGAGDLGATTVPGTEYSIGQMFSVGTNIFTVWQNGAMLSSNMGTGTFNTTTGSVTITGSDLNTTVYFYPSTPVMGLILRETANINFEPTIAFDQQFSYQRSGGGWERITSEAVAGDALWSGTDSDFFWSKNARGASLYQSYLYVTNNVIADGIRYYDDNGIWNTLQPDLNSGLNRVLSTCRIIIGFKDRIIALNTVETESGIERKYKNRARFSQNGSPIASDGWYDDTPGLGGYIDASTEQAILTVEFIRDRLIVYFERSTWELVYTGNEILPFRWQQLNSELGVESTFSIVGFDKGAVGIGQVGIHSCDGVNVTRLEEKIPDDIYKIQNANAGLERTYGIRDYYRELVYWTIPNYVDTPTYPNKILLWNYKNHSWAFINDSFTCFGYFQKESNLTWADLGAEFGTWAQWNEPWGSGFNQTAFPDIVAGNQEGFVFNISGEKSGNAQSLYITNMTSNTNLVIYNHNLKVNDYILIEDCLGITSLNSTIVQVYTVVDANNITIDTSFSGTYTGAGYVTRISNINIKSKQWNPGTKEGLQFLITYIDFLIDRTDGGEVSLDYFNDFNSNVSIQDKAVGDVLLGNNKLLTRAEDNQTGQANQKRIWHRYFMQSEGQTLQIQIYMSDDQMRDLEIAQSDIQIDGLILYVTPQGRIVG